MHSPPLRPVRRRALALAIAASVASGAVFADAATVLKSTDLRASAATSADVSGKLKAKETVDITARQGAWVNVTSASGASGWARSLNFRGVAAAGGSSGRADLGALFATGATGAASTNAAKGFNANDLKSASPDMAELAELDAYASNADDARRFAGEAPVQAQPVPYLAAGRRSR